METLIRVRKGDTCVVVSNNYLFYALALEDLVATKETQNNSFTYPTIFRFTYVESVSPKNRSWINQSFIRRTEYDEIYSDHITGSNVGERVMPYPTNLLSKETQKQIEKFKTKFKL
jgi:hypothetical protein